MQRMTISIDDDLLDTIDRLAARRGYTSRSEAIRDIVRDAAGREPSLTDPGAPCLGALVYVYEHDTRDLARRLTNAQHDHATLSVATLHVHLNHADCLEIAVLRGPVAQVQSFADSIISQRGVRHGQLQILPTDAPHAHEEE